MVRASAARVHHFRTSAGREIDFLLEDRAGTVVGIEVKSGHSIDARNFAGLRLVADALGDRFARGSCSTAGRRSSHSARSSRRGQLRLCRDRALRPFVTGKGARPSQMDRLDVSPRGA